MANRDPISGVATIAINVRGTSGGMKGVVIARTMNAQKPRHESTTGFVRCPPLAPSARAGSERPAAATIKRITKPTQKIGEGPEGQLPKMEDHHTRAFDKSRRKANATAEQTTSEARPAPAASATRSQ